MFAILYGNPIEGFDVIGPFEDHDDAVRYAERECDHDAWWVREMSSPESSTAPRKEF